MTFVFIHGFLDGAEVWDGVVAALGDTARDALRVDLAGMGTRVDERGPYSLDHFADDVARQVRALDRPVVLVGQSMGAQVAELVATQLGHQVRALALLTPAPLRGMGLPGEVMQTFSDLGGNPSAQRALRRKLSVNLDGERLEMLVRLGDRVNARAVGELAQTWNRGHEQGAARSAYKGPVLIVRGGADPFITNEVITNSVAPRFDSPTVATVAQAGHWSHVEQPDSVAQLLSGFLNTIDRPSGTAVASQGWTRAFEQKSSTAFAEAFAADVVLEASVMTKPIVGVEQVKTVMGTASGIYEALAFTDQGTHGLRSYLEWEARAFGGELLYGITILTKNEAGKIVRAAIHHRPLGSALKFSAELGRRLQGKVDASHFYSAE